MAVSALPLPRWVLLTLVGLAGVVVQLLPALESGGVERSTLEIADALVRAGHRALVVSAGGRLVPKLEALGAEHIALDIGRKSLLTLRHIPALRRVFQASWSRTNSCRCAGVNRARICNITCKRCLRAASSRAPIASACCITAASLGIS